MTSLRVLLIDDSESDATLLIAELRRNDFDPVTERVDTEIQMREALKKEAWDIILTDYRMPQLNGLEVLKIIKASPSGYSGDYGLWKNRRGNGRRSSPCGRL